MATASNAVAAAGGGGGAGAPPALDPHIMGLIHDVMKISYLEEAFNCVIVHRTDTEAAQIRQFHAQFTAAFQALGADQQKLCLQHLLQLAASRTSLHQLKYLLAAIQHLITGAAISPRLVCEQILTCDRLVYGNRTFWLECFALVRHNIAGVDYKGVREVMKACRDKIQTFPYHIPQGILPQLLAVERLLEHIFDRSACLLPAYFIANEMQKLAPLHWKIAGLTSAFVEDFRDIAQMVSIIGHAQMRPIVEHFGFTDACILPWRLDCGTLKLSIKGILPFDADLLQPQHGLLKFVISQPYSKDMICSMLNLQKQCKMRCVAIEEQLVGLIMSAMERAELEMPAGGGGDGGGTAEAGAHDADDGQNALHWLWVHISSQLIYFVLFQFASFPCIVAALHERLGAEGVELRRGRDYLMWTLLQFVSGSIHRNPLSSFLSVLSLYDTLYPEREPLPVPDCTRPYCTRQLAPTCIWFHLQKKAQSENMHIQRPMPITLKKHHEFLQLLAVQSQQKPLKPPVDGGDYTVFLMCNAYSTHPEYFSRPMAALVESINKYSNTLQTGGGGGGAGGGSGGGNGGGGGSGGQPIVTAPLPSVTLDCLTVHTKMSLIHSIVSHMIKQAQIKTTMANVTTMDPALAETYSRLLVYTEIESLGIKTFLTQLLPAVFKSQAWGILHTLLEMVSYRMHHIQPFYRVQLLSHLHSLASVPQTNMMQLYLCVESTALRLITGLGSAEVQPQLSRYYTENKVPGSAVSVDNEELNRALILSIARSMHITGGGGGRAEADGAAGGGGAQPLWCKDLLDSIMAHTPHTWAPHTLACMPPALAAYFAQAGVAKENKALLKKAVEEEFCSWQAMSNEADIIAHFGVAATQPQQQQQSGTPGGGGATAAQPPLFLCLMFKMILEHDAISPVAYKILERIGARALSTHLRKLCDYLVYEVTHNHGHNHINNCVDTINAMIWKYNIFSIDRLVLTLALRTHEGKEAHICFFIVQLLLLKTNEFRNRVTEFTKDNEPDHWRQSNWHDKHLAFHAQFRERFHPEPPDAAATGGPGAAGGSGAGGAGPPVLPVYFGNVCLRFLPVLDLIIHRFLEVPAAVNTANQTLEVILNQMGCLYKFHERPITYLYHTLHYYETRLRERPALRRRLVGAVVNSLKSVRPEGWALSAEYRRAFLEAGSDAEALAWQPGLKYYMALVRRFVGTMTGRDLFYLTDWRFNEFPNAVAHALYVTCVELLSVPVPPATVANSIIDVILVGFPTIAADEQHGWINAVGILLTALPENYWACIYDRLLEALVSPRMLRWTYRQTPFEMFNFRGCCDAMLDRRFVALLAVAHAVLHHSTTGQIATVADYIKEKLKPVIQTEQQLIYLCHLFAPFSGRLDQERARVGYELTTMLYELLEQVDKKQAAQPLVYMDPICDLLYHIKYMYVGDMLKNESEAIIRRLRPALQMRLRFITHLNVEEIAAETSKDAAATTSSATSNAANTPAANRVDGVPMDTTPAPPAAAQSGSAAQPQAPILPSQQQQLQLQQQQQQLNNAMQQQQLQLQQQQQQHQPNQQQQQHQQQLMQQQLLQQQQQQQMLQQQQLQQHQQHQQHQQGNLTPQHQQMLPHQSPQHPMQQQQTQQQMLQQQLMQQQMHLQQQQQQQQQHQQQQQQQQPNNNAQLMQQMQQQQFQHQQQLHQQQQQMHQQQHRQH